MRKEGEDGGEGGGLPPPLGGAVMQFLSVSKALVCAGEGRCSSSVNWH